jgi:hypothetical protein
MARPTAVPGIDPSRVSTPDELAACLDGLRRRRGLSYEAMEKVVCEAMEKGGVKLPPHAGRSRLEPLPKSTVGEIVTGKRLPTKGKLLTFLAVCGVASDDYAQWLAAWERASTADLARPDGAVRVVDGRACWACTPPSRSKKKYLVNCPSTFHVISTTGCVPD